MGNKWVVATALVLTLGVLGVTACQPVASTPVEVSNLNLTSQQQGIWVSGQGKVAVTPDIAYLRLGIESQETSVSLAQEKASAAMKDVVAALKSAGVADKDIQTQYFSISQVTRWDDRTQQSVVIGYRVSNMVTAKIRDIDKAGSTIDAVAKAAGDLTRIDGISFSVNDSTKYYEDARKLAVADAQEAAKQLAQLAGVELGEATYISESSYNPSPVPAPMFRAEAAMDSTSISPGEMEITANVQITYSIK